MYTAIKSRAISLTRLQIKLRNVNEVVKRQMLADGERENARKNTCHTAILRIQTSKRTSAANASQLRHFAQHLWRRYL